ncbi:N-acetylglucosamine-6-phosphate deacetylase [Candidatus Latescibacterota bacterium]
MLLPGFVDLQVNGFRGVDFINPGLTEKDFVRISHEIFNVGTTVYLPTLVTTHEDIYRRNLPLITTLMDSPELKGRVPGIHIEGPFISPKAGARGVHMPELIIEPDIAYFDRLQEYAQGKIKLLTIAPEVNGAAELTRHVVKDGVTVSLGHHLGTAEDVRRLADAGATALTHLGNGIPSTIDRHENPLWAGMAEDRVTAMIITDSHHIPPAVIQVIAKAKGLDRLAIVSDASPIAGMPPGRYKSMGGEVILQENGLLHDPDKGYLAGSSAMMLDCMNVLASVLPLDIDQLMQLGYHNPLALIGLDAGSVPQPDTQVEFDEKSRVFTIK